MGPLGVVNRNGLTDHAPGLGQIRRLLEQELLLENAVDSFRQGILIAVVAVSHRADQSVFMMNGLVLVGTVLDSPVRMMDQRLASPAPFQRHLQGLTDLRRVQAVMDVVTHNLA